MLVKPWKECMSHFCRDLTNAEWDRLVEKDMTAAIDLSYRMSKREHLLKFELKKRVPKHRYNKGNPLDP
jgi:hypothetical protein